MNAVTVSSFKKPYFISELGEEGLLARDVAESLGISLAHVHQKIERSFKVDVDSIEKWRIITIVINDNIKGLDSGFRELQTYGFNTRAAKAFVATYRNRKGLLYLDFLFDCEQVATNITPKLIKKVQELESEIVTLKETSVEHKKLIKKASRKGMMLSPVFEENLIGKLEARYELKRKNEVDETLQNIANLKHISKINEGLSKKIEMITDKLLDLELQQRNTNLLLARGKS